MSAVVPAYNAGWCVARAVRSVLDQEGLDADSLELIVVDDGSTDDTAAAAQTCGPRVRVLRKPNGGLSSARNAGIGAARGRYVAFLDADDWWMPSKIARQLALMDADPGLAFCSTAARVVDPSGAVVGQWSCASAAGSVLESIFAVNAFVAGSGSAVLARREALLDAGGFDESLRSLEDIDMWMRLAARGGYACIPEPLAVIVRNPDSMSRNLDRMREAARRVMRKNRALLPARSRGGPWRSAYAGMLTDYAKWSYRAGRRGEALADLARAALLSPLGKGRYAPGMIVAILRGARL